jgi:replicative DNA helicase
MNIVPYNEEFERAVICGVLQDPLLLPKLSQVINDQDFFKENHKEIWKVISEIETENLDSLAVQDRLTAESTKVYFKELVEDSDKILPSISNIQFYAEVVRDKSRKRAGIELGREIQAVCYNPDIEGDEATQQLENMFATFLQKRVLEGRGGSTKDAFTEFRAKLGAKIIDDPNAVRTGFHDVDLILHRLEGLLIVAARPGMGKTAFAINVARNVAADKPVLFFSVEQSRDQIFERMLATESEVSLEDIRTGAFLNDPDALAKIDTATAKLAYVMDNLHVDETASIPTTYITSVARQKKYEFGSLGLIVIDYLHILQLNQKKQTVDSLGDAVKEIRALGKELECPIILLSQLRRPTDETGSKKNKRPDLTDLRSSGEIEQSADVVMFLYRESYYDEGSFTPKQDIVEVDIKKHRNGRPGRVLLEWLPEYVKFRDQRR